MIALSPTDASARVAPIRHPCTNVGRPCFCAGLLRRAAACCPVSPPTPALMRLVVDTSVLVGELLRKKGRARLGDDRLELFLPEQMWAETQVELPRRIQAFVRRRSIEPEVGEEVVRLCLDAADANVVVLDEAIYSAVEDEARARSLCDPADWPVVAGALALSAGIWTNDNGFLGTGIATWTTESLQAWLDRS